MARLKSLCEKCTSTLSGMPKSGSKIREDIYAKMIDQSKDIDEKTDQYVDMLQEIESAISTVSDDRLQTLLRYRYINGYTWEQIEIEMNKSHRWVYLLHQKALNRIKI